MVREFKKVGVAAAVAGALLGSSYSHATVQLSEPGDVMLVPYAICNPANNNQNTLVGLITFAKERLGLRAPTTVGSNTIPQRNFSAPWVLAVGDATTPTPGTATLPTRKTRAAPPYTEDATIHWYFFDSRSVHRLDGVIPATDNDFVRFDWCGTIQETGQTTLNGVNGYLVFTTDEVDRTDDLSTFGSVPSYALYGHAYQIQGDWESQAFIPVLPNPVQSYRNIDRLPGDASSNNVYPIQYVNVVKRDGYPAFTRLLSGTNFSDIDGASAQRRDVFMRYFLDPALATENRMVFWFNFNQGTLGASAGYNATNGFGNGFSVTQSRNAAGETYDSEQVYRNSFSVSLPDELNILVSTPAAPAFPGMIHEEVEAYSGATVVNTGIVRLGIPEAVLASSSEISTTPWVSSGVSFNMLGLGAGGNATQLQTEMATQGPVY
jgi:hypothetical protein